MVEEGPELSEANTILFSTVIELSDELTDSWAQRDQLLAAAEAVLILAKVGRKYEEAGRWAIRATCQLCGEVGVDVLAEASSPQGLVAAPGLELAKTPHEQHCAVPTLEAAIAAAKGEA